jgi:NAD(P)-dependent dehydrogenase (short-subunit alcohol dehydrogenase family)
MSGRFSGRVALVTGGGSGIGRATALAFASEGAGMVVVDIADEAGHETVEFIQGRGGEARFIRADVSVSDDSERMVRETIKAYGRLDYAHNNAGIARGMASTVDCAEEDWDRIVAVNLKGVWLCMKTEIPRMLENGGGAIVNTASIAGLMGVRGLGAYVASKHGVVGLTKTAALEYAQAGIRINAVCPGWIRTPLLEPALRDHPEMEEQMAAGNPSRRIGSPEEVAAAVVWLCSEAASYVTGHAMVLDGGHLAG